MGKKVTFVRDYIKKEFCNAKDLEEFIEDYVKECAKDIEYLNNMYEYLCEDSEEEGMDEDDLENLIERQKEELDEFLKNDKATIKDLKEFLEMQKKDLEDSLDGGEEEDDYEIDEDFKDALKQVIREVLAEEKDK